MFLFWGPIFRLGIEGKSQQSVNPVFLNYLFSRVIFARLFFFVPTLESGEGLCLRVCFGFFSFFIHEKLGVKNNCRKRLIDISY